MSRWLCRQCKHLEIDYDVVEAMGEVAIADQWWCRKRYDEECVPNCRQFEPKEGE